MTGLPLRLGRLSAAGFSINRSGVHWLRQDGHVCRAGEVIGYCNISLRAQGGTRGPAPFEVEDDLQVAFAPRVPGRLLLAADSVLGGYLDVFGVFPWDAETEVGFLEPLDEPSGWDDVDAGLLRLMLLAGRRMTTLAHAQNGVLPGWHASLRAWWCDEAPPPPALLVLGICDAIGPLHGDGPPFFDLFESQPEAGHVIIVPNHPVAPASICLTEQFLRTPVAHGVIRQDLMRGLAAGAGAATDDDFLFAGALLRALDASPIRQNFDLLLPGGLASSGPPGRILLSLLAEPRSLLRHKKLGYHLHILGFHRDAAGPAMQAWLNAAFEIVTRSADDIRRDYLNLFDTVAAATGARFLVLNRMSTSGREDIVTYAPFDAPMGDMLANIASKELNLLLHDAAVSRGVSIIDVDAIAAAVGGGAHLPDGVHQNGTMQSAVRAEILRMLGALSI